MNVHIFVRAGIVTHRKVCRECEGLGEVELKICGHYGADCPCPGSTERCEECDGTGLFNDEECACRECDYALDEYEGRVVH